MKQRLDLHFAVIGIGAFGKALSMKLSEEGAYVAAVDSNMDRLDEVKDYVSDAVCFDATDAELLENKGITEVDVAVISIGDSFEPVVLITMHLLNAGVKEIYGRAKNRTQEQILENIGITDIIHPERQVAERMGVSLVRREMSDVFDIGEDLAMFEVEAPESMAGYTLEELEIRQRYNLNVITIKRAVEDEEDEEDGTNSKEPDEESEEEKEFKPIGVISGETEVKKGDLLLLFGNKEDSDKLLEAN